MSQGETFLRLSEVAARYGISRATIWRATNAGTFPTPLKIGRSLRWRFSDLARWENEQTRSSQQDHDAPVSRKD